MASETTSPPIRFFVLKKLNEGQHDTEFAEVDTKYGEALRCPRCEDIVGPLGWEPPYRGELELYGKEYGDVLRAPGGLVVTERFAKAFKAEGLKGLGGFHPIEVTRVRRKRRGPKPGPPPRYLFVTPAYGQTALDMERSRLNRNKPNPCTWCRSAGVDAIDGLALEEGTWTGEDIFRPRGLWGIIFVSERFMRFAERHAMSHFAFIPIEKYVWDPLDRYYSRSDQEQPPTKG